MNDSAEKRLLVVCRGNQTVSGHHFTVANAPRSCVLRAFKLANVCDGVTWARPLCVWNPKPKETVFPLLVLGNIQGVSCVPLTVHAALMNAVAGVDGYGCHAMNGRHVVQVTLNI